jgi:uncharacterized protein (DUF169 family)
VCVNYCPTGAIGKGKTKANFDNKKIAKALEKKLALSRGIAAMKYANKAPSGVLVEEGLNFWCHICGDIFEHTADPVYFATEASICGGAGMIGLATRRITKEDFAAAWDGIVIGEGKLYGTKDASMRGRSHYPRFRQIHKGVVVGPLEKVSMPDIILFPINGHQLCVISTAYAFDTGENIMGCAGSGACLMAVAIPLTENRPVFTSGDHGGRTHMRLKDEEILACFPYRLVPGLVKNLDRTIYAKES